MDLIVAPCGLARWGGWTMRCALGRGVARDRREGDGLTPAGRWPMRRVLVRRDRLGRPASGLPVTGITRRLLWCDDPGHALYNRQVRRPFAASAEELWRADALYDLVVVLGHNDAPVTQHRGSAVFLHVAAPDYAPTAGCIALSRTDLLRILRMAGPGDAVLVRSQGAVRAPKIAVPILTSVAPSATATS